ncbi:MAG: GNAT family N-acetyltransferase [Phaeodactylibacter sp.]|nr:GNAT family N-acetyltransferase [Phaeodactylibacter sp.]MCB9275384.1 GNAT family N-acetyltransferase [Lewinellaceae bacterium]
MNALPEAYYSCLPFHRLSAEELYAIMALRQEVFVVEQNCPYLDADGKDPQCHHLMGHLAGGRLVTYTRLIPPGLAYAGYAAFGRVVTSMEVRGKGFGRPLMEATLSWMQKLFGAVPVKISAQTYLIPFYESYGFSTDGELYLEDDIPHIAMINSSVAGMV